MSTETEDLAWGIFSDALDLEGVEREAFLERACGANDELRREVESLLSYGSDPRSFLTANRARPRPSLPLPPVAPDRIGHYQILRMVGEGGMGIVYEAIQENPKRRVALKIMRPGYFMPGMQKRFEFEAQVLGRLQHPGIAHVYEADTVDLGNGLQPFFAMEFIKGQPITAWAADHNLDVGQRLELIAKVCDASHHAHQKGVLHRDLKPDNVMVDESGRPKILDFGVARPLESGADGAADDNMTKVGQMIGTLAYMSPEQVRGDSRELDTRSDVYALGVICYQLLSGKLPHETDGLSITQSVDTICNRDAARLGSIVPSLRGDVELLVAKALEKDKERRYQSAIDFAADIRRFLAHEPVLARAPSAIYQIRKFAKRHKGLVGGMVLAAVFLVAGVVAAVMLAIRAETQRWAAVDRSYRLSVRGAADALDRGRHATAMTLLDEVDPELRGWAWRHVRARTEGWTLQIEPSAKLGRWLVFTPDGTGLLTNLQDGSIGWWNTTSGALIRRLTVPGARLTAVARNFPADGRFLAGGSQDGRVFLWDVAAPARAEPQTLRGHKKPILDLCWTEDGTLFSADASAVWQWRGASGKELATDLPSIGRVLPGPRGDRLAVFTPLHTVTVFDLRSGRRLAHSTSKLLYDGIWSEDGGRLICATRFQNLHVLDTTVFDRWTADLGSLPRVDQDTGHDHWIVGLARSPDGKLLAGATHEGVIVFRDAISCHLLGEYAWGKPMCAIAYRPDGRQLACLDYARGALSLWDLPLGGASLVLEHAGSVTSVCWSPDNRLVACATSDSTTQVYDAAGGELLARLERFSAPMFAGDSLRLVGHDFDARRPAVVDLVTDQREMAPATDVPAGVARWWRDLDCHDSPRCEHGTYSKGWSRHVQFASGRVSIRTADGSETIQLQWPSNLPLAAAWGPDEHVLAVGGTSRTVRLYDTATWQQLGETGRNMHNDKIMGVDLSPDGKLLVTGCRDNMIRLFDVASLQLILEMPGHESHLAAVVFSPDGSRIASGSGDATLRIWDTVPRHVRATEARKATARRAAEAPRVERLLAELRSPERVAERLRADPDLSPQRRYAALRALMERGQKAR